MKRLGYALAAVMVLVALAFVLAALLIDPAVLAQTIARQASAAVGQPVSLGEVDLVLFPMPAARVKQVRIGGEQPLAEIDEVRLRVSLLPLLLGQIVLRSLEIDAPRVRLPMGEAGPELPAPSGAVPTPAPEAGQGESAPLLAITRLAIRDGSFRSGEWRLEQISVDGSASIDGSVELRIDAVAPGLGRLEQVEVDVEGILGDAIGWVVEGRLAELDLAGLDERAELGLALAGSGEARVRAHGSGDRLLGGELRFEGSGVSLTSGTNALAGELSGHAVLGGDFRLDLTQVELRAGDALTKPPGGVLVVSGPLGTEPSLEALSEVAIEVATSRLDGIVSGGGGNPSLRLKASTLDLEPMADWWSGALRPVRGRVEFRDVGFGAGPAMAGELRLEAVELALEHGSLLLSGPVRGSGRRVRAAPLEIRAGEELATIDASYDLVSGEIEFDGGLDRTELEPFLMAAVGQASLVGTATSRVRLSGPPDLARLKGSGSFEITPGRIRGFSLVRSLVGEVSRLPLLVARMRGRDLSRYEEEEFRLLSGRFSVSRGFARFDELRLEYQHSRVLLAGTVGLLGGELDLSGRVVISEELDAELSGDTDRAVERVFPITGVKGTIGAPRIQLDRDAIAKAVAVYTTGGPLRESLEERLGSEGADAVESVLEQLLRGGSRK